MDWAEDRLGISEEDFHRVWRYEEKYTTVVQWTSADKTPLIWSLSSKEEWEAWFKSGQYPELTGEGCDSGLVLILAKRTGEREFKLDRRTSSNEWLSKYDEKRPVIPGHRKPYQDSPEPKGNVGRRSVRTLPFTQPTFDLINQKFHLHHSISSVVSKTDVPTFYSAEVEVDIGDATRRQAQVYNSRTTNAWDMDLAMTVTHFPASATSYAILFGCPLSVENEIIQRISRIGIAEASHPLVMPGIFAEIERARHIRTVEQMAEKMEGRMFALDYSLSEQLNRNLEQERAQRQQDHKDDYLDMAYLKNGLISWKTQLLNMLKHAQELDNVHNRSEQQALMGMRHITARSMPISNIYDDDKTDDQKGADLPIYQEAQAQPENTISSVKVQRVGRKVIGRLQAIIDEYDDKIRDCTMRLDGMSIATQWSQGETSVEIGIATSKDSKHMRSIAIVTMVFLPGTFLASVFSMSFFTWFNDSGTSQVQVSSYVWIYIAATLICTAITIGLWYYFNIWRRVPQPSTEQLRLNAVSYV